MIHTTSNHSRSTEYRNLFRAIAVKPKVDASLDVTTLAGKKVINKGWKTFWRKRGYDKPPRVSDQYLGEFELPTKSKEI